MTDELYATAVHEAGHAVAAWVRGGDAGSVSVVARGDRLGGNTPTHGPEQGNVAEIRAYVVSLYAGFAAECRVRPAEDARAGCGSDDEEAARWLRLAGAPEAELRAEAERLVAEHWDAVLALAREAAEHGELNDIEVSIILEDTPEDLAEYRRGRPAGAI